MPLQVISGISNEYKSVIPYLLRAFSRAFRHEVNLLDTVLMDSKGIQAAKGEVVKSNFPERLQVTPVIPSNVIPTAQKQEWYQNDVRLTNWDHVRTEYTDREIAGAGVKNDVIPNIIKNSTEALADHLNQHLISELKLTPNIVTTTGTVISTYSDVVKLNKKLSMNAPTGSRVMLFGRETEAELLLQPQFLERDFYADEKTIKRGVIGTRLGYDFMPVNTENNEMISEIAGDILFTTTAIKPNRDVSAVATTVAADGKIFYGGNILEIVEVDGVDVTAEPLDSRLGIVSSYYDAETGDNVVAGGTAALNFRFGNDFKYLAGGTFKAKMLNVLDEGFAYQKTCVTVVNRAADPLGFRSDSATIHDKGNSLTTTMLIERAHRITYLSTDILFGMRMTSPASAVRHVKIDPVTPHVV